MRELKPYPRVLILATMTLLSTVQKLPDDISLTHFVAVDWVVLSVLVLARPRASELSVEYVI